MKRLVCVICILVLTAPSWAGRNPYYKNWLTPERLERWQGLSQNMTYLNMYTLMEEMYYLERKPFSEPLKQILLKMTKKREELRQARRAGKPIILPENTVDACGEIHAQFDEMVSWQNDPRFIDFQSKSNGGIIAARGLARIGETGFKTVIELLRQGHSSATRSVKIWMEDENSFLSRDPAKQAEVQQALIEMTRLKKLGWIHAVDALRYFPSPKVFTLLELISRTDPKMHNGLYPLRVRAQQSLEHLRSR